MSGYSYKLEDLLDINAISQIFNLLFEVTSIPYALLDMEGKILTGAGWQSICSDFHRVNPDSQALCVESDMHIRNKIDAGEPFCIHECPMGLVDSSCPVNIEGSQLGTIITGQLLHTPLTEDLRNRFRSQAVKFGFDENAYIEALEQVPVFPIEKHTETLKLLANITEQMTNSGLINLKSLENTKQLHDSEALRQAAFDSLKIALHVVDPDLRLRVTNRKLVNWCEQLGLGTNLVGEELHTLFPFLGEDDINHYHQVLKTGETIVSHETNEFAGQVISTETTKTPMVVGNKITGVITLVDDTTARTQAEAALVEIEAKQRAMISNISDVIGIIGADGLLKYKSSNIEKWFGWKPEELVGRDGFSNVHPDDSERIKHDFFNLRETDLAVKTLEYRNKCKDGTYKYIQLTVTNLFNDPIIQGLLINYHDITDRKKMLDKLQSSEEKFRKAFFTSPDSININRLEDGKYVSVNQGFTNITGFTETDVIGKTSTDINIWENQEDRKKLAAGLLGQGMVQNQEARFFTKAGQVVHGLISATIIELDGVQHVLSIIRNINDRKRAEEELAQSERDYRGLFDMAHDTIILFEEENEIVVEANQHACDLYGYSREEFIGMSLTKISTDVERGKSRVQQVSDKGYIKQFETIQKRKDGSKISVEVNASRTKYQGKSVIISLNHDTTERKLLEAQLRQSQKLEAVGTMVGGISHEFNNILQSMFLHAGLVQDELPDNDELQANFQHILDDGERASALIKQILTFSRKTKVEMQAQPLSELIDEVLVLERASLPSNIELTDDIDVNTGMVLCDKTQIHQILINLCNNAQHSMEAQGGTLMISLRQIRAPFGESGTENNILELKVSDTGHGIDPQDLGRIFDPFFTTKQFGQGTGLGLTVVHGIVEMMDSKITVTSKLGQGTTFKILFPLLEKVVENKSRPESPTLTVEHRSILLVDDEESIRSVTQVVLMREGHTVTSAHDGKEALETFKANPGKYDLIVTDLSMPQMSGVELTRYCA